VEQFLAVLLLETAEALVSERKVWWWQDKINCDASKPIVL